MKKKTLCETYEVVITGLVPVIPLRDATYPPKRDGRDEPCHDNGEVWL